MWKVCKPAEELALYNWRPTLAAASAEQQAET